MLRSLVLVVFLVAGLCSPPARLTATVDAIATHTAAVGGQVQLVVKVTNTGPAIAHLGFVFRSADRWYERHEMLDLSGCAIASDASAFDCGDLATNETKTYSFRGIANSAGTFHFELALRELVRPFHYVNDHTDGADASVWDETVD
jgi:hypothetical protein